MNGSRKEAILAGHFISNIQKVLDVSFYTRASHINVGTSRGCLGRLYQLGRGDNARKQFITGHSYGTRNGLAMVRDCHTVHWQYGAFCHV